MDNNQEILNNIKNLCLIQNFVNSDENPDADIQRLILAQICKQIQPEKSEVKTVLATFNTRLKKVSSFSTLITPNYRVNSIICSVPKGFKVHVFSL